MAAGNLKYVGKHLSKIFWKHLQSGNKKELDYAAYYFGTSVPKLLNHVQRKLLGYKGTWTYPKYNSAIKRQAKVGPSPTEVIETE